MITSDKQCLASRKQLAMLKESLTANLKKDIPDEIKSVSKAQLQELIDQIESEVSEYECLKTLNLQDLEIHSVHDLMVTPIRYRIILPPTLQLSS